MSSRLIALGSCLLLVDVALRFWRAPKLPFAEKLAGDLTYLAVAWIPFFLLPHLTGRLAIGVAGLVALGALVNFSRMVGLSGELRFFVPAFVVAAVCFPLAGLRSGTVFSALPVLALLTVAAMGALGKNAEGFLQKLCLAWVSVMVYGYLYAHAVLIVQRPAVAGAMSMTGPALLALMVLLAKFADVAWVLVCRTWGRERLQLLASPLGGLVGGILVAALAEPLPRAWAITLGVGIGGGVGFGSRAYDLIVADVTGQVARQRKGTMLFGFGLALAAAYWLIVALEAGLPGAFTVGGSTGSG